VAEGASVTKCLILFLVLAISSGGFGEEQPDGREEAPSFTEAFVKSIDFGGLFYLSYEHGELDGEELNTFFVSRAYFTMEADVLPKLSARITLDANQDLEGDGRGDMEVRLKYAFAKYHFGTWGPLHQVNLEAGIVHMVWLDFEEHIDLYRMLAPMFMERSGIFNSADFGLTLAGGIGPDLPEAYRDRINSRYAARHGSFAIGLYNGGGYHGVEINSNKAVEARLAWRPVPDRLPGLQVAGLVIIGDGNVGEDDEVPPPWETYNLFSSYEFSRGACTLQYVWGEGNQRGNWVEPADRTQSQSYSGHSVFGEYRFDHRQRWRVVGAYDHFERRSATTDDTSDRYSVAVGYDLGKANILLLNYVLRDWVDPLRDDDWTLQVVQQIRF
jgi:hypothetical protein